MRMWKLPSKPISPTKTTEQKFRDIWMHAFPTSKPIQMDKIVRVAGSTTVYGTRQGRLYSSGCTGDHNQAFSRGFGYWEIQRAEACLKLGLISKADLEWAKVQNGYNDKRSEVLEALRAMKTLGVPVMRSQQRLLDKTYKLTAAEKKRYL